MSGMRLSMRVWDAPVRLYHWAILLLLICSYVSVRAGWMQVHFLSGYTILTLTIFRVLWGFVGSDTARFSRFLKSPIAGLRHLAHFGRREPDNQIGHNAAGGWMVLVLIALLLAQAGTGLFATDDAIYQGPLERFIGSDAADRVTSYHAFNFYYLLLSAIVLHVVAVFAYAIVKRHDLVRPMITGKKRMPVTMRAPRMARPGLALLVLVCAAGAVLLIVQM